MQAFFQVTYASLRHVYATNDIDGRIPRAWITWGAVKGGSRWGFITPWCQAAVGCYGDPPYTQYARPTKRQPVVPFLIIRLWWRTETHRHFLPQCPYDVHGRFYRAIVWVQGRGFSFPVVD